MSAPSDSLQNNNGTTETPNVNSSMEEEKKKSHQITAKYLIGDVGGDEIRQMLASTESPFQAIENFRLTNGLHSPKMDVQSFLSVLELTDLHELRRRDVYKEILGGLLTTLLSKIGSISQEKREGLLKVSFPFVGIEDLRSLPFALLQRTKEIPLPYLRQLGANEELYRVSPIEVKRQIWEMDEAIFLREIQPLIDNYIIYCITNPELFIPTTNSSSPHPIVPKKRREKNEALQSIVQCIGDSFTLYKTLVKYCTILFITTGHIHYCTLRGELLMSLHDHPSSSSIFKLDPCHMFAWCLDACIGDNKDLLELRRVKEIENLLQQIPSGSPIIGDFAMIALDCYNVNYFIRFIFNALVDIVNRETTPKNDESLKVLTQIILLGSDAQRMLLMRDFRIPKVGKEDYSFYIRCTNRILDDKLKSSGVTIPNDREESEDWSSLLSQKVTLYYLITRIEAGDEDDLQQHLLTTIPTICKNSTNLSQLHSFFNTCAKSKMRELFLNFLRDNRGSFVMNLEYIFYLININSKLGNKELFEHLPLACEYKSSDPKELKILQIVVTQLIDKLKLRVNPKSAPFLFSYSAFLDNINPNPQSSQPESESVNVKEEKEEEITMKDEPAS